MDVQSLRRILTAFADSPADVDLARGTLLVQVREEMIEAQLFNRHGDLYVEESGIPMPAAQWVVQRIGRLPLLADRILSFIPRQPHFVTPGGKLLDQPDLSPEDEQVDVQDASERTLEILGRHPAGTASVLYLTSDAGEGKTTLITHLARTQAQRYREKKADWLLVPVSLGGRTFMRFDDVIIGALVNRLRFPFLYYEAFIELVRLNVVVPALDGFEEMFIEGSAGDAISALGSLVNTMQSSGSVLIAARKAYFEYKNLHSQTRLFDSLGGQSVSFARLALSRWDREKFLQYSQKRGVPAGEEIYQDVATKLGPDHPLLTRAVLVKRLLDVATEGEDRATLLSNIANSNPNDFFRQFIGTIISREARDKWLDKLGEVARPLISENDHYELLSSIALEMWTNSTEALGPDVLDLVSEMFAEARRTDKVVSHQIVERVKQHALIVQTEGNRFSFDHQEFYHFFLGEAVGRLLVNGDGPEIRRAFREAALPPLATDEAAKYVHRVGKPILHVVETVNEICLSEPRASFVKENLGGIVIRLLDYNEKSGLVVKHGSFPLGSLSGRKLTGIEFQDCYFQSTSLGNASLIACRFTRCEFESLEIAQGFHVEETALLECKCRSAIPVNTETAVFVPQQVRQALLRAGFTLPASEPTEQIAETQPDEKMILLERMLRAFMRSTGINENTLYKRLGAHATEFFHDVLPQLQQGGIVREVPFKGAGTQKRFRLGVPLGRLERAMEECDGVFDRFIELANPT